MERFRTERDDVLISIQRILIMEAQCSPAPAPRRAEPAERRSAPQLASPPPPLERDLMLTLALPPRWRSAG
ncbi:MAG: hypothetical protein E6G40_08415 [Actinobacteria bacterium]|nr:MAG: hypothetical protein E6G40_08415 [Actinomycetota bacterium]